MSAGSGHLLRRTLPGDLDTPVGAHLKLVAAGFAAQGPMMLLESVEGGAARGRYSALTLAPDLTWTLRDRACEVTRRGAPDQRWEPPLDVLQELLDESALPMPPDIPSIAAGLFGYLGYEAVGLMERLPEPRLDELGVPDGLFVRPGAVVVFDHVTDELLLAAPVRASGRDEAEANALLDRVEAALAAPVPPAAPGRDDRDGEPIEPVANLSPAAYRAAVGRAKAYIAAGDIFQAVPSRRFSRPFGGEPFAFYRALRRVNPAPFLFYLDVGPFHVVGASPEILVRLQDGIVTVRPIAGTRRRGRDSAEDAALEAELLADPKERAEHLMLLDLGRNDVGRVARPGEVRVTEFFSVERYRRVMHIVSNVEGPLRDGLGALDALRAGFPAGTVSGAPKIRAMEIIHELEPARRGIYGGAVGYFGADGALDTCIALRTALIKDGVLHVQAGGGVVHDSDPEAERLETEAKASALFEAAAMVAPA